ncbi:MAG TPA: hypothetical protein VMH32_01425 [Burkholderiales bacterium]|nr:hypothetical protein [Burkholderiales bacterium]
MKKPAPAKKVVARKPAARAVRKTARPQPGGSGASVIRFGLPERDLTVGVEGPLKLRPAARALLERLTGAVVKHIEHVPEKIALDLLKQGTDAEMMVGFATTAEAFPELATVRIPPLAKARARGMSLRQQILAREDMLTLAEAAQALGLTAPAVNDRFRTGKLIALEAGARGRRYPAWQFEDEIAGKPLETVLSALKGMGPWACYRFFTTPDSTLEDELPLEVLKRGDVDAVVEAARLFAAADQGGH